VRVVLWVTQMVNVSGLDLEPGGDSYVGASPNFEAASECGYFVNDGELSGWWKGVGGGIDFFNPDATTWWHRQQDPLFEMGVAGFKLDFGDSYLRTDPVRTVSGPVPHQAYSEAYYADFYHYGVSRLGPEEFVTMVRPWDESYDFEGRFFARRENTPVGWVGDQRRDFVGLSDALDHIFRSADAGYVVLGSDIGGYLDRDDKTLVPVPFDLPALSRWVSLGALTPFMELHGRANLAPWTVPEGDPDAFVALYRYWATLHHELVPFFYSLAEKAYAEGGPMIHPQGDAASWAGDYRFVVGDALLVAPILDATGVRDLALPAGSRWLDWWDAAADPVEGGTTIPVSYADALERIPLFVREGAIIPATVSNEITGLGNAASADHATWLIVPASTPTSFETQDEDGATTQVDASRDAASIAITLSRVEKPTILRVRADLPAAVYAGRLVLPEHLTRAAFDAATSGWFEDASLRAVWIKIPASAGSVPVTIETP
jgi:alpha-glucosidase (family GH31 glycosyl hydrolase)